MASESRPIPAIRSFQVEVYEPRSGETIDVVTVAARSDFQAKLAAIDQLKIRERIDKLELVLFVKEPSDDLPLDERALAVEMPTSIDFELAGAMLHARAYSLDGERRGGPHEEAGRTTTAALRRVARYLDVLSRSARRVERLNTAPETRRGD